MAHEADLMASAGETLELSAEGTSDPDGDKLAYNWWQYVEAGSYKGKIDLRNSSDVKSFYTDSC